LSSGFVTCPFEECEYYGKLKFTEMDFFLQHLASKHDNIELYNLAFEKGIIKDQFQKHSLNFVVRKIAKISRVLRK